jgi:predicted metal-binding protein
MCVLNCFNALILKIIFKKYKNIILIYFRMKNTLKNNHNHTLKQKIFVFLFSFQKKMVSLGLIKPIAANSFSMN